jgi:transcriptional regulator with XRE-family HTH domain
MPDAETRFADQLNLALKALSIGRTRLAGDLGVDKSMVSRWLAGSARPSTQNLEKLTRLIALYSPGFSLLDWEADYDSFVQRIGMAAASDLLASAVTTAEKSAKPAAAARQCHPGVLPFGSLDAAALETARRAPAYAGRWYVTRLAGSGAMKAYREYAMIRPDGDGLRFEHYFGTHWLMGWLIVSEGALYALVSDSGDGSYAYYCLHGVVGPKAQRLDGVTTSVGGHRATTPFSQVIVLERAGDLEGDEADDAWGAEGRANWGEIALDALSPELRTAIAPDCGATVAAAGGEAVLRVPIERSLTSGGY